MAKATVAGLTFEVFDGNDALTVEEAKKRLGWKTEEETGVPLPKVLLRDKEGNKVFCSNNKQNRPFRLPLATRYAKEHLRKKWKINGETIVFNKQGECVSGQHRLIGLILAEQTRCSNKEYWKEKGLSGPIKMKCIVVSGVDNGNDTADTNDIGQPRSLGDVIFRNKSFKGGGEVAYTDKDLKSLGNIHAGALRLVWIRTNGKNVSDAPHFPHSEALEVDSTHPGIREAVEFIYNEDLAEEARGQISGYFPLPAASALCYLMSVAKTKEDGEINTKLKDKAEEFWTKFASGAALDKDDPILVVKKMLGKVDKGSGAGRDEAIGMVVKAWNAWIDGKKVTVADLKVAKTRGKGGKLVLDEEPRIGGLDVKVEKEPKAPAAKKEGKKAAAPKEAVTKVPGAGKVVTKKTPKPRGAAAIKTVEGESSDGLPDFG
jgi:hypothetical protein